MAIRPIVNSFFGPRQATKGVGRTNGSGQARASSVLRASSGARSSPTQASSSGNSVKK